MGKAKSVKCDTHGLQTETFVCGHVARSLITRTPVGFWWPEDSDQRVSRRLVFRM
jgi:hypothetical protein